MSCNCRTPVNNYYKNFGPRLGLAYSADEKTVFRAGFGILFSHAGGTGGAGGAATGTGQAGFNSAVTLSDSTAGPAFYLNSANANWGGPGYSLPPVAPITAISQTLGTGYYVCSGQSYAPCNGATGTSAGTGTSIAYPDPLHWWTRSNLQLLERWNAARGHQGHYGDAELRRQPEPLYRWRWQHPRSAVGPDGS